MVYSASIVDAFDVVAVGLKLCDIGLLINSRHCWYSSVVEWLVSYESAKVWCGVV